MRKNCVKDDSMFIRTIDIAHPPMSSDDAEQLLDDEIRNVRSSKEWRVLKVIHGSGNQARPAVLKEVVRNWAYRNRTKLLAMIAGEEYDMFDAKTVEMRKACGQIPDQDLGTSNSGITVIWIK
jgi:hypothetical protein